ncbi:ROK family transcriptional regulator, partial [Streptomyces sp. SID4945]|nr:ROK family transcriptional regulator [Streptomyces sp. SID4945]
ESPPPTGPAVPVPAPTAVRRPAAAARPQGATMPVPSRGRPSWP